MFWLICIAAEGPPMSGSRSDTPCLYRQALSAPQLSPIDPHILNDIENEARRIATSVDTLTESLAGILRSVGDISFMVIKNVDIIFLSFTCF